MANVQNIFANVIRSQLRAQSGELSYSVQSLSSGKKANPSTPDYTVGSLLSSQASVLRVAIENAGKAKNLLDTAKVGIDEIVELLEQQKTLAVQAQDDTLTDNERASLDVQFQSLADSINYIAANTQFNNVNVLNGSISGTAAVTSATGQAQENYTILNSSYYTTSGTTESGDLATSNNFAIVEAPDVGATAATSTLTLTHNGGGALAIDATIEVNGTVVSFGSGATTSEELADALVTALEQSTDDQVRKFTYSSTGGGAVEITATELGTAANSSTFNVTGIGGGGTISAATLGSDNILFTPVAIGSATGATAGENRSVSTSDAQFDSNLMGPLTNFTATLDSTGTQNAVTFTVDVNGTTYTSQAVTLFGDGGYNTKGDTIKSGQIITFYNSDGATDSNDELVDSAFTLELGASDVTVSGSDGTEFATDLNNIAAGFETQLGDVQVNQRRDVVLAVDNATGGDYDITAAADTIFVGIQGFDSYGTNAAGDIYLVSDNFGDDGSHGRIGQFSFSLTTDKITTTVNGETFTADLSQTSGDGVNGYFDISGGGGADYNNTSKTLTFGNGLIVFESEDTADDRQLVIDVSNVTATDMQINTASLATTFSGYLNTIFGVEDNSSLSFQVGEDSSNVIAFGLEDASTSSLYVSEDGNAKTLDISTEAGAEFAEGVLDNAIDSAMLMQADVNSLISSFSSSQTVNDSIAQALESASSVLLDTDYAEESVRYSELQTLLTTGALLLSDTNSNLNNILKLLDK